MQKDPSNWIRRIREDRKHEILNFDFKADGNGIQMTRKIGERWIEGGSYGKALVNAYARVGQNIKIIANQ